MAAFPGRYFHAGLGELPDPAQIERGEYGARAPIGLPPPGGGVAPPASPNQAPIDISGSDRQSLWQVINFTVGMSTAVKLQDFTYRKFLLIQNRSGTGTLLIGFGYEPTVSNGVILAPGQGFEPFSYPINDIWALATEDGVSGILIYGT